MKKKIAFDMRKVSHSLKTILVTRMNQLILDELKEALTIIFPSMKREERRNFIYRLGYLPSLSRATSTDSIILHYMLCIDRGFIGNNILFKGAINVCCQILNEKYNLMYKKQQIKPMELVAYLLAQIPFACPQYIEIETSTALEPD